MFLHAAQLKFNHPASGETMTIQAPLPEDLDRFLGTFNQAKQSA
jgi:23S rRNA pseudouridine955/2504/2580 synthase